MKTHFAKNTYQKNFHKETLEISKEKIMEKFLEILPWTSLGTKLFLARDL